MANGIRIDELDATVLPNRDHVVPAMKDGLTVKLTVGQILDLLGKVLDPDEVGSRALFAALNLSDLDDPAQARENLGATEIGHALFTAASKAAGRSAIDALGPDETADRAFRQGNILGTVSQSSGIPTGAIIERGSNANGEYVRYADGTQICTKKIVTNVAIDSAWGSFFQSSKLTGGNFAASFIEAPTISFNSHDNANNSIPMVETGLTGSVVPDFFLVRATTGAQTNRTVSVIAVGRWF